MKGNGKKSLKIRERDYRFMKEKKGEKSFPEYVSEVMEAVKVLEEVRRAFKVVTGKDFTLEEVAKELVALGILERGEDKRNFLLVSEKCKGVEVLEKRWEFARSAFPEEGEKSFEEALKNFYYVPDFILEEIKKEADRHGDSVIRILLEALMAGARVVRKDYYVISNRLSEKMKGVFAVMDRKDVEKFRKKVKEIVNRGVEIELKKIEKKLRKEKKLS